MDSKVFYQLTDSLKFLKMALEISSLSFYFVSITFKMILQYMLQNGLDRVNDTTAGKCTKYKKLKYQIFAERLDPRCPVKTSGGSTNVLQPNQGLYQPSAPQTSTCSPQTSIYI